MQLGTNMQEKTREIRLRNRKLGNTAGQGDGLAGTDAAAACPPPALYPAGPAAKPAAPRRNRAGLLETRVPAVPEAGVLAGDKNNLSPSRRPCGTRHSTPCRYAAPPAVRATVPPYRSAPQYFYADTRHTTFMQITLEYSRVYTSMQIRATLLHADAHAPNCLHRGVSNQACPPPCPPRSPTRGHLPPAVRVAGCGVSAPTAAPEPATLAPRPPPPSCRRLRRPITPRARSGARSRGAQEQRATCPRARARRQTSAAAAMHAKLLYFVFRPQRRPPDRRSQLDGAPPARPASAVRRGPRARRLSARSAGARARPVPAARVAIAHRGQSMVARARIRGV